MDTLYESKEIQTTTTIISKISVDSKSMHDYVFSIWPMMIYVKTAQNEIGGMCHEWIHFAIGHIVLLL